MWTYSDLSDAELHAITKSICMCSPPDVTGTRNGYRCAKHHAQDELTRRLLSAAVPESSDDGR